MQLYDVITPRTWQELDEVLREAPLVGRSFELITRRQLDELAVRRGERAKSEGFVFTVEMLYRDPPPCLLGFVMVEDDVRFARIDSPDSAGDAVPVKLQLVTI